MTSKLGYWCSGCGKAMEKAIRKVKVPGNAYA